MSSTVPFLLQGLCVDNAFVMVLNSSDSRNLILQRNLQTGRISGVTGDMSVPAPHSLVRCILAGASTKLPALSKVEHPIAEPSWYWTAVYILRAFQTHECWW